MNNLIIIILGGMMAILLIMAFSKTTSSDDSSPEKDLSLRELEEELKATEEFLIKYEKRQKPSLWQRIFGK